MHASLQPILYRGRLAAAAGIDRFFLAPHIEALEEDHPDRHFVSLMCCFARDVMVGATPGPYHDEAAELAVRSALVDDRAFAALSAWGDSDLAEHLGLPLDQVRAKRRDLRRPERVIPRGRADDRPEHRCSDLNGSMPSVGSAKADAAPDACSTSVERRGHPHMGAPKGLREPSRAAMRQDNPQPENVVRHRDMAVDPADRGDLPNLSPHDVAATIGLSYHAVLRAVHRGDLVAYKICGRVRIRRGDVLAWIDACRLELERQTPETVSSPARGSAAALRALEERTR